MFRASMRVMGAAKVVRVHAKVASKPKDWVWPKPNVEMSTLAGEFGYWWTSGGEPERGGAFIEIWGLG